MEPLEFNPPEDNFHNNVDENLEMEYQDPVGNNYYDSSKKANQLNPEIKDEDNNDSITKGEIISAIDKKLKKYNLSTRQINTLKKLKPAEKRNQLYDLLTTVVNLVKGSEIIDMGTRYDMINQRTIEILRQNGYDEDGHHIKSDLDESIITNLNETIVEPPESTITVTEIKEDKKKEEKPKRIREENENQNLINAKVNEIKDMLTKQKPPGEDVAEKIYTYQTGEERIEQMENYFRTIINDNINDLQIIPKKEFEDLLLSLAVKQLDEWGMDYGMNSSIQSLHVQPKNVYDSLMSANSKDFDERRGNAIYKRSMEYLKSNIYGNDNIYDQLLTLQPAERIYMLQDKFYPPIEEINAYYSYGLRREDINEIVTELTKIALLHFGYNANGTPNEQIREPGISIGDNEEFEMEGALRIQNNNELDKKKLLQKMLLINLPQIDTRNYTDYAKLKTVENKMQFIIKDNGGTLKNKNKPFRSNQIVQQFINNMPFNYEKYEKLKDLFSRGNEVKRDIRNYIANANIKTDNERNKDIIKNYLMAIAVEQGIFDDLLSDLL